jgi:hypothetical protein
MSELSRARAEAHTPAPPLTPQDGDWHRLMKWRTRVRWGRVDRYLDEIAEACRCAARREEIEALRARTRDDT